MAGVDPVLASDQQCLASNHQGKGLKSAKLEAMIGMFHDAGVNTILRHNVAAGSERAGFSGSGVACGDTTSFVGNIAHSSLAGYWFDHYRTPGLYSCVQLTDFTAFKIWEYGVYSEVFLPYMIVTGAKLADATVGISLGLSGADSLGHTILDAKASIRDSLVVGQSNNGHCGTTRPSLHTCTFYMAWCDHLPKRHVGIYISKFQGSENMAPTIKPWSDAGTYPALYGYTEVEDVTFARFRQPCSQGPRANLRDYAISGSTGPINADAWSPVHTKSIEKVEVAHESVVFLPNTEASWINQVHVTENHHFGAPTCSLALAPAARCYVDRLLPAVTQENPCVCMQIRGRLIASTWTVTARDKRSSAMKMGLCSTPPAPFCRELTVFQRGASLAFRSRMK
jgi:hypothetical protein